MLDKITFSTTEQTIKFMEQFPDYGFVRENNVVMGDFYNKDLSRADLSDADLSYIDLHESNLSDANLRGASILYADLSYGNLTNAILTNVDFEDTCLTEAIVTNTHILSVATTGALYGNMYASPVYRAGGRQTGWGFHLNSFYGWYPQIMQAFIESPHADRSLEALAKLKAKCDKVFQI